MTAPKRIQRKRIKGWRMPERTVYVGRPTEWGNPWKVGDHMRLTWPYQAGTTEQKIREVVITPELAVVLYRMAFTPDQPQAVAELGGQDLACWCPLDQPCHADVLLELANGATS